MKLLTDKTVTQRVGGTNREQSPISTATTRTETTHGPTSSMAIVMRAVSRTKKKDVESVFGMDRFYAIYLSTNDFNNGTMYTKR